MKPRSLRRRFFLHSAIALIAVMCVSVFVVDYSYRSELVRSAEHRLRLHIFNLLSITEKTQQSLTLPTILRNPRFNDLDSGLWALVLDQQNRSLWHSLSLVQLPAINVPTQEVGSWVWHKQKIEDQTYIMMSYKIAWDTPTGLEHYQFIVAENEQRINQVISDFRWWLGFGFLVVTLLLLAGQQLVLYFSFLPIGSLENEIAALEKGEQTQVKKLYPVELSGVTASLNGLIEKEHEQRKKYRASMADLAHSLKTPLAIVKAELQVNSNPNEILQKALTRIDQSIEYQLRRAIISGHSLLYQGTPVVQVLNDLIEVLNHVHRDSDVAVSINIEDSVQFYGDENDLMEVFGNLLDNAFRYAKSEIRVNAQHIKKELVINIEDDGVGFSNEQAAIVFKRGERLDSQDFGQGIGLSVVFDIVNSYDGSIEASRSSMGGACFSIIFPTKLEEK